MENAELRPMKVRSFTLSQILPYRVMGQEPEVPVRYPVRPLTFLEIDSSPSVVPRKAAVSYRRKYVR